LGLWKYRGVFFSRHGNFTRTVQYLVKQSDMGLEAGEIGRLVGLPARSFMSQLPVMPEVVREKQEGRFVYFSAEPQRAGRQKQLREEAVSRRVSEIPADAEAIAILVDRMKHPASSYEQTAQRLRRRGAAVGVAAIGALLAYHGVEKKRRICGSESTDVAHQQSHGECVYEQPLPATPNAEVRPRDRALCEM